MANNDNPYAAPHTALAPAGELVAAACFKCGSHLAVKSKYTWWGGFLGPKLFDHVKCADCGQQFNAKTGGSNNLRISLYLGVWTIFAGVGMVVLYRSGLI